MREDNRAGAALRHPARTTTSPARTPHSRPGSSLTSLRLRYLTLINIGYATVRDLAAIFNCRRENARVVLKGLRDGGYVRLRHRDGVPWGIKITKKGRAALGRT